MSHEVIFYSQFCSFYGSEQVTKCPTRVTCGTSSLSISSTAEDYKEALSKIYFPNYENFGDVNKAYENFI